MNPKITEVIDKIESATVRERCLVFLSCVAVVYLLWDFILYTPLSNKSAVLEKELLTQQTNIETLKKEEKMLMLSLANDPNRDLQVLQESMTKRKVSLEKKIEALSGGLVDVEKLSLILQDVLKKTDSLVLESLQTLPVEELEIDSEHAVSKSADDNKAVNAQEEAVSGIYKHGVSIVVKGTYFQLLEYLHRLESMPSIFYWEELRYEQDSYPNGFFHLKVYTLTRDEGYSGV
ncbi:MAG: hypothetical protein ACRBCS_01525 [Cellvibrionaceae bacterium]